LVAALAPTKGVDRERCSSVWNVVRPDESGELLVGGKDLVVDRGRDLFGEAFFWSTSEKLIGNFLRGRTISSAVNDRIGIEPKT
jgi:hypothetical protein